MKPQRNQFKQLKKAVNFKIFPQIEEVLIELSEKLQWSKTAVLEESILNFKKFIETKEKSNE